MQLSTTPPAERRFAWVTAGLALAAVLLVSSKGWIGFIQDWASYFWWLGYGDGMVRRGLAGQLFQLVFGKLSQKALYPPLMSLTVLWIALLAGTLAIAFGRTLARISGGDRALFLIFSVGLFVSQLWPMLTFTAGYLDPLLLVLAAGSALCLRRGWTWGAAAMAAAGPFIHEFFVFLVPFILASSLEEGASDASADGLVALGDWDTPAPRPRLLPLAIVSGASLLAAALVILLSKRGAAEAQFHGMPLTPELKSTILATSMNQSLSEALGRMLQKIGAEPGFAFCNVLFFVGPALLACLGLLLWRAPADRRTALIQAAAGLLPASAVLIAWDLSRFLVITTFTAGALFLWTAERRTEALTQKIEVEPARSSTAMRAGLAAMLVLAGAYALYPFTYTYFGYRSFFQYFPPNGLRDQLYRSSAAPVLESVWGHQDDPFADQDVTCRLQPAGDPARGCAHPIKTGEWVYGPYIALPLGRYRVTERVEAPPGCTAALELQVTSFRVRAKALAVSDFNAAPAAETSVEFRSDLQTAGRSDFELRTTQLSGPTCGAEVRKVFIRRLGN